MIAPYPEAREKGVILANALALVVMVAMVAAGLMTRSDDARDRLVAVESAEAAGLGLDALSDFGAHLLADAGADGGLVHLGQGWAASDHALILGESAGLVRVSDLQGRLNVNWLADPDNSYAQQAFTRLFVALDLPPSLLSAITDYLRDGGPRSLQAYLRSDPPLHPRGGPIDTVEALRPVSGMTPAYFARLEPLIAALPIDSRINLNTAAAPVLDAALHPLPAPIKARVFSALAAGPIPHLSLIRDATIAHLQSEDIEHLPFDRFALSSRWFQADLTLERAGWQAARRVIYSRAATTDAKPSVLMRWALVR